MSALRMSELELETLMRKRQARATPALTAFLTQEPAKPSKYRSKRTEIDGLNFDSRKEARRYVELKNAQAAGEICDLRIQQPIACTVNGQHVCDYIADFTYRKARGNAMCELIYEDVKGKRTDIYQLKRKLVKACTGIEIKET